MLSITLNEIKMKINYVYELWIGGEILPFYVGKTNSPKYRLEKHKKDSITIEKHLRKARKIQKALNEGKELIMNLVYETTSLDEVNAKEIELIAHYGRKDLKTGCLYNLTDGGDGHNNYKWSKEAKERRSKMMLGHSMNKGKSRPDMREKMISSVHVYDRNGNFLQSYESQNDAAKSLGCLPQSISKCLRGKCRYTAGNNIPYQFSRKFVEQMPILEGYLHMDEKTIKEPKIYKQTEEHRRKLSESNKKARQK